MYIFTLILNYIIGFFLLKLINFNKNKLEILGLSFPIGLGSCTLIIFLMDVFGIKITFFSITIAFVSIAIILIVLLYKKTGFKKFTFKFSSIKKIDPAEWIFIIVIFAFFFISLWRCYYLPITTYDSIHGIDLVAKYAVEEGQIDSKIFSDLNDYLSTQPHYAPFTALSQIIFRLSGHSFGKIWLSFIFLSLIIIIYVNLRQIVHPILTGFLTLLLILYGVFPIILIQALGLLFKEKRWYERVVTVVILLGIVAFYIVSIKRMFNNNDYADGKFYGYEPGEFKKIVSDLGMDIISSHTSVEAAGITMESAKKMADSHAILGVKYCVQPWIEEVDRNIESYKRMIGDWNEVGKIMKGVGIQFGYHNHNFEFVNIDGVIPYYDIFMPEMDADLITMELDMYWATKAGQDPVEMFKKYPGRFQLYHFKDMSEKSAPFFTVDKDDITSVGAGLIDFKRIYEAREMAGMKYLFVEDDNQGNGKPFEAINISIDNIIKDILV